MNIEEDELIILNREVIQIAEKEEYEKAEVQLPKKRKYEEIEDFTDTRPTERLNVENPLHYLHHRGSDNTTALP